MDNKLLLAVNFLGIDKLTGPIRNIIASGKQGAKAMKEMQAEAKGIERELKDVRRQLVAGIASGAGLQDLVNKERQLAKAAADVSNKLDQQKRKWAQIGAIRAKATAVADKAGRIGGASTLYVTTPLTAFGVASAKAAIDAEELQSAFNVTFGKNAEMMNRWAFQTGNAMGRSIVEMQKGANTFGIFFNQAAPASKAAEMSKQFAVLAQDLGSFFNTDTQTAMEKLRSGLSGESEPLRDFGVFLTEAKVKAKALAMGLKPLGKEFSEQQKIMVRYALILDETKNAQGDVARTSQSTANRIRASQAAWQNLQVVVGQRLVPALTPLINQLASVLEAFGRMSPETQGLIIKVGLAAAAFGPLMLGISGIASGVAAAAPAIRLLASGFRIATVAAAGFNLAMLANPIVLIVAAVAAAGVAIWYYWDNIKAAFVNNWTYIRNVMLGAFVIFQPFTAALVWVAKTVHENWGSIKGAIMSVVRVAGTIFAPFIAPWERIIGYLSGLRTRFVSMGADLVKGLIQGFVSMHVTAWKTVGNFAAGIGAAFAKPTEIKSPSRLFMRYGAYLTQGLAIGINKGASGPLTNMRRIATGLGSAAAVSLAAPAYAGASAPGAGRGMAPSSSITFNVTIQLMGADVANPKASALAIKRELDALLAVEARGEYTDV